MKLGNLSTLLLSTIVFISCTSRDPVGPIRNPNKEKVVVESPKDLYDEAKDEFETNHSDKFDALLADLDHWSDTITTLSMNYFIQSSLEAPVLYSGIKLSFDDTENDIVGNTLIYTVPEFDSVDLRAFTMNTMHNNYEIYRQLEFHRAVNYVMLKSSHDLILQTAQERELPTDPSDVDYTMSMHAFNNMSDFATSKYMIVLKTVLCKEPKVNLTGPSESGALVAGVIIYDREMRGIISEFAVDANNTKSYTPETFISNDNEEAKVLLELQFDLVNEFRKNLEEELKKRVTVQGEFPKFKPVDKNGDTPSTEGLSIDELIRRNEAGQL